MRDKQTVAVAGDDAVKVYWLEQSEAEVPAEDSWLSAAERVRLSAMHVAKRRADWRLGRWTAKSAIALYLSLDAGPGNFREVELRPAASGAPDAFVANQPAALAISLSHRAGTAMCAVGPSGAALGCDLESIEPHSDGFIADFLAAEEQEFLARASAVERDRIVALIWSAKESALKSVRAGLRLDTRAIVVSLAGSLVHSPARHDWHALQVRFAGGKIIEGWWQESSRLVRAVVATPRPLPPIALGKAFAAAL